MDQRLLARLFIAFDFYSDYCFAKSSYLVSNYYFGLNFNYYPFT